MHDIVVGARSVQDARDYYAQEFLDHRRGKPTPYLDSLRVPQHSGAGDPDEPVLSEQDLERAAAEGQSSD